MDHCAGLGTLREPWHGGLLVADAEVLLLLERADEDEHELFAVEQLAELVDALIEAAEAVRLVLNKHRKSCSSQSLQLKTLFLTGIGSSSLFVD